jgi:pimeloyl-ACP methyl ester carboxylesterase
LTAAADEARGIAVLIKGDTMTRTVLALAILLGVTPALAQAQSDPHFIAFAGISKGALYRPDQGPAPHVGILVMHRTANFLNHRACTELSRRGFLMLCMNTRYENNEAMVDFEKLPLDVKAGVEYLRRQGGITKVVLFAHSGGGPLMSFYQAVAENGTAYCTGENKLTQCGDDLAGLPPADGIVFADAHPGNAINLLRSLNAAVANENNPPDAPPIAALDMFDPENGFNPKGPSHYSAEFQARYFKAQADRMNRLIDIARDKLDRIRRNAYPYPDDDIMIIPRGGNPGSGAGADARLFVTEPDIAAINSTAHPVKLLRNDGTVANEIVKSVFVANPGVARGNLRFRSGTKVFTLRSFLSAQAVRAGNAVDDIDYCSTNNSTVCAVQSISVPVMFAAMGAHYFIRDNEIQYEMARSKDKDFIVIEGANHGFTPCEPCATTPGQYSNTVRNLFDYVAAWLNKRF